MKKETPSPPKAFHRFFQWFCHSELKKYIEGDLLELYSERLTTMGKQKADIRFIADVILLFRPGIIRPIHEVYTINPYGMYINYSKVALRNLLKYKTFSFINIFGLAVAMSVCMLVMLMVADQYQYDTFHHKKERIFRILSHRSYSSMPFASTPPAVADKLREDYTIIESATNFITGVGGEATYDQTTAEMRGFFSDEHFFTIFDFELEQGDPATALTSPNTMVIPRRVADQLFGDQDPLGKTIDFVDRGLHYLKSGRDSAPVPWGSFTVTGVIADRNYKSHLKFDVLISSSSRALLGSENKLRRGEGWDGSYTYALLRSGKDKQQLTSALSDLFERLYGQEEALKDFSLEAQALTEITPGIMVNQPPSFQLPIAFYYFLGFIALAIMLSACLNYTNLSTARAITRAKEIGVRKVTGAYRRDLIFQFLGESVITSFFALALAIVLLIFIKPALTSLWLNRYLNFELEAPVSIYFIFAAFALALGIIAGFYPALKLSAFHPVRAIKNPESISSGKLGMRKILSISQFVVSLFFIVTSIVIYTQFQHFMQFKYGFRSENMINIALQGNDYEKIAHAFSSIPEVSEISASQYVPATGWTSGMDIDKPGTDESINFRVLSASGNFPANLGVDFIAGTHIPEVADSLNRFILVNETAVAALGFDHPMDIVGKTIIQTWNKEHLEVVGVVQDFWLRLPIGGEKLDPAFIKYQPHNFSFANVRISSTDLPGTIAQLEARWKAADPAHPFKFEYYEDELASTHAGIFDVVSIAGFLAFIAITIACLGMLGMATYTAERKRKEVGIRKILGAGTYAVAFMLSRDFLKVLLIAVFVGAPLTYLVNNLWLENFPNRAPFGFGTVVLGALILLFLGLLTIGSQTLRASKSNPVETLKME